MKAKEKSVGIFNGLNQETLLNIDAVCDYPEHELFFFCLISEKYEISKLFWKRGNVIHIIFI